MDAVLKKVKSGLSHWGKIMASLALGTLFIAQMAWGGEEKKNEGEKTVYPEIWGVELPTEGTDRAREALIFQNTEDRILISYWFETTSGRIHRIYDFFAQSTVKEWRLPPTGTDSERAAALTRMEVERNGYEEAKGVTVLDTERKPQPFRRPGAGILLKYDDGSLLQGGAEIFTDYGRKTYFTPCNYRLSGLGRNWKGRASAKAEIPIPELNYGIRILRLYTNPRPLDPEELCGCTGKMTEFWMHNNQNEITDSSGLVGCNERDAARWALTYRVRALQTMACSVLQDGTFLIKDRGYPTVIRFRPYLESPYLATRPDLFLLPDQQIAGLAAEAVSRYRQENNKQEVGWGFDEYTAEDLAGIFKILDPIVTKYLEQRPAQQKAKGN